jgi:hypothetical protein
MKRVALVALVCAAGLLLAFVTQSRQNLVQAQDGIEVNLIIDKLIVDDASEDRIGDWGSRGDELYLIYMLYEIPQDRPEEEAMVDMRIWGPTEGARDGDEFSSNFFEALRVNIPEGSSFGISMQLMEADSQLVRDFAHELNQGFLEGMGMAVGTLSGELLSARFETTAPLGDAFGEVGSQLGRTAGDLFVAVGDVLASDDEFGMISLRYDADEIAALLRSEETELKKSETFSSGGAFNTWGRSHTLEYTIDINRTSLGAEALVYGPDTGTYRVSLALNSFRCMNAQEDRLQDVANRGDEIFIEYAIYEIDLTGDREQLIQGRWGRFDQLEEGDSVNAGNLAPATVEISASSQLQVVLELTEEDYWDGDDHLGTLTIELSDDQIQSLSDSNNDVYTDSISGWDGSDYDYAIGVSIGVESR